MVKTWRSWRWVVSALLLLGPAAGGADAWGPRGHRVSARLAEARLTPEARAAVRALLLEGDSLATVADWADHDGHNVEPTSGPWHYVNVPVREAHYDPRFCPRGGCVVSKIDHYRKVLADRDLPHAERARALLFFVHFVQDVHQPMHVGDNKDQGGNRTQVVYDKQNINLHRLWDTRIIEETNLNDREWVERLQTRLTPENVARWSGGGEAAWADESLSAAKRAYYYPEGVTEPLASGTRLGADYQAIALPIIEERLAQSGLRLANELNALFVERPAAAEVPEARARPARRRERRR